ncbi:membrane protein insertion efficiency factor YidD [Blattabacterium cuenoti]|uniref:membrane protein insertion efficiency factor YidD n=1 Tax=Blattabacterium cuenoti TaxID=1653831 RepID=UPI00163C5AE9|nr:membrane protein insertion efficiency factor YidD [Blattabacterium cuenoti]
MKIINNFFIQLVKLYQLSISPWIGKNCRYIPTCSEYMIFCLKKFHFFKAIFFSIKRIFRCNPWNKSGYDPI